MGTISVKVTADDGHGGTVDDTFDIVVADATLLTASSTDNLVGTGGADAFTAATAAHWHSTDTVPGGAGADTLTISAGTVNATLDTGSYDDISSVETIALNSNQAHVLTIGEPYYGWGGGLTGNTLTVTTTATTAGITVDASGALAGHKVNLSGGGDNDTLTGGADNDTLLGAAGDDTLDGDAKRTRRAIAGGAAVTVDVSAGTATGQGSDTLSNIENVLGSGNGDNITGSAGNNSWTAGRAMTRCWERQATTRWRAERIPTRRAMRAARRSRWTWELARRPARAAIRSTNIENILGSGNADNITGSTGRQQPGRRRGQRDAAVAAGDDTLEGGANTDTAQLRGRRGGDGGLERGHGDRPGQRYAEQIENVLGSANADNITGSAGNNSLEGGAGNDMLNWWHG